MTFVVFRDGFKHIFVSLTSNHVNGRPLSTVSPQSAFYHLLASKHTPARTSMRTDELMCQLRQESFPENLLALRLRRSTVALKPGRGTLRFQQRRLVPSRHIDDITETISSQTLYLSPTRLGKL